MKTWLMLFLFVLVIAVWLQTRSSAIKHTAKITKTDALVRSSVQWNMASKAEKDPVIAFEQASTACALLDAARTIMSDEDIEIFFPKLAELIENTRKRKSACVLKIRSKRN